MENLKIERVRAAHLAVVDEQEVKVCVQPMVPMYFVEVMCPFGHRKCPYSGSLESMVGVSERKLHCHQSRDFVASKMSRKLNVFVINI